MTNAKTPAPSDPDHFGSSPQPDENPDQRAHLAEAAQTAGPAEGEDSLQDQAAREHKAKPRADRS